MKRWDRVEEFERSELWHTRNKVEKSVNKLNVRADASALKFRGAREFL